MSYTLSIPDNVLTDLATGNKEAARQSLLKLVNVEPTNTRGWLYLAVALPRAQAILALRRVLVLEPGHQVALHNLKRLYGVRDPRFSLELKDVNPKLAEKIEEENLATFGHDQPTMNLTMVEAKFGEETSTLPDAFRQVINISGVVQAVNQLPDLSDVLTDLLETNILELDLSELATLDAQVEITRPGSVKPVEATSLPLPAPIVPAAKPLPKIEVITTAEPVEAAYPPPAPQPKPKPDFNPAPPPLTWVSPLPAVEAKKPAVSLGRLHTLKARSPRHDTAGAADSGREVEILRPTVLRTNLATYSGPWLGFATSGICAALFVIAVLFSLYWFLG